MKGFSYKNNKRSNCKIVLRGMYKMGKCLLKDDEETQSWFRIVIISRYLGERHWSKINQRLPRYQKYSGSYFVIIIDSLSNMYSVNTLYERQF